MVAKARSHREAAVTARRPSPGNHQATHNLKLTPLERNLANREGGAARVLPVLSSPVMNAKL
jgi:hypothetical protein